MKRRTKDLSSNMEDYLETVALLNREKGIARVRDIGRLLNVKSSSVTSALSTLSKNRLVVHERYGYVGLTEDGKRLAQRIQERHDMLIKFLTEILKINFKIAKEDACKMEHSLSPQTFKSLTKFIEFVEICLAEGRSDWLKSFDYYFKTGKRSKCKIGQIKQKV